MLPAERKRRIVERVSETDGQSVGELATALGYSKATIRRDLRELAEKGLIERSHGGALPVATVGREQTYGQKEVQNLEAKRAIARRATGEVRDGDVVFFDAGTTTMQVAREVAADRSFLAVTNSPRLTIELGEADHDVMLTGGTLRQRTRALVGPTAEAFMERMHFDLLFLGTNGICADAELTTPNEDEARMKELMIERAARVVLVADHTKVDQRTFVTFATLSDIDCLVTDRGAPTALREACESADVRLEIGGDR
ncbi:HTH-type transcriptional regulator GlpR [Haloferacaceae archaeon DSL9]